MVSRCTVGFMDDLQNLTDYEAPEKVKIDNQMLPSLLSYMADRRVFKKAGFHSLNRAVSKFFFVALKGYLGVDSLETAYQ